MTSPAGNVDAAPSATMPLKLRSPGEVMRLKRMGAFFPTRLSFMRSAIRRLSRERAQVTRRQWDIDAEGFGCAVYSVGYGGHTYSLVAFSVPLAPENRTDRVIAEAWDTSYVLFDGVPQTADIERLRANVPLQEAGRFEPCDLVLSRANKSVRLFAHVVDSLASGHQPDEALIGAIGYLMRTTAVYGNGKFGIADRHRIADRPGLGGPFQAEMLSVWLIRGFTIDLVEHVARQRSPAKFVPMERRLKRHLGVGNATGLGMAPFLVSHPVLLNNWMLARETALARVRAIRHADDDVKRQIGRLFERVRLHLDQWNVDDVQQTSRINALRIEVAQLADVVNDGWLAADYPWERIIALAERHSLECQELIVGLVLEPHGALIDDLADCMASDSTGRLNTSMTTAGLRAVIADHCSWALQYDFQQHEACQQFWYVSEEKLEPRLGDRFAEPGADRELPLDIARRIQALDFDLAAGIQDELLAEFLLRHPEHRYTAERVQIAAHHPYSEIHDNLIGSNCLPIDMLRCKLSFFGASKFDPKSDRWTRITLYQGAPLFDELDQGDADDWWLPVLRPVD